MTALLLASSSCTFDDSRLHDFMPCSTDGDCPAGASCVDQLCESGDGGIIRPDVPVDTPVDGDTPVGTDGDLRGGEPPADRGGDRTVTPDQGGSCSGQTCGSNQMCCNGICKDILDSADNCGGCGNPCPSPNKCCNGMCKPIQEDESNCGDCGHPCDSGQQCCQGQCGMPGADLCMCTQNCAASGLMCCEGTCFDTTQDPQHCGGCSPCDMDQLCCDSGCVARDVTHCTACDDPCVGNTPDCCPTGCTDTQTDPANCGTCGHPCGDNERCCGGTCTPIDASNCLACGDRCQAGEECCPVIGCTNTQAADVNNCGSCGHQCTSGQGCCTGACKDIQTDSSFCGSSCMGCPVATHCSGGRCVL
jgi:hypothetical protein